MKEAIQLKDERTNNIKKLKQLCWKLNQIINREQRRGNIKANGFPRNMERDAKLNLFDLYLTIGEYKEFGKFISTEIDINQGDEPMAKKEEILQSQ